MRRIVAEPQHRRARPCSGRMRRIGTIAAATLLVALSAAPAEAAKYNVRVGIGDQNASMFDHPGFQALKIKRVRYFIPWNAMRVERERLTARAYVLRARRAGASVLMHISSDDLRRKKAKLPSKTRYRRDVTRLVKYFRKLGVKEWGARNEANHDSQPTYRSPSRAAYEFKTVRRACKGCSIVALDVLDQKGVESYMRRFYKALGSYRRYAKIVGIHNYSSVNRKRSKPTGSIIRTAKRHGNRRSKFYLTETGGLAAFSRSFPYSESRQANRLRYMFTLTKRYRRDVSRLYSYNWTGAPRGARFDAGLTNADGSLRPAYEVFRRELRSFLR
jgi:hypothetical protein